MEQQNRLVCVGTSVVDVVHAKPAPLALAGADLDVVGLEVVVGQAREPLIGRPQDLHGHPPLAWRRHRHHGAAGRHSPERVRTLVTGQSASHETVSSRSAKCHEPSNKV